MKTEAKKKTRLSTVPEAALEEAGLAKETILAAIPMDGVVLVTKDSMPIVELLQMLDRLNLYAAEMLTAVAAECGPCEKADEALTVEDVLEECEVTVPAWAREQAGIPENAKLACFVNEGEVIVGEAEACTPDPGGCAAVCAEILRGQPSQSAGAGRYVGRVNHAGSLFV